MGTPFDALFGYLLNSSISRKGSKLGDAVSEFTLCESTRLVGGEEVGNVSQFSPTFGIGLKPDFSKLGKWLTEPSTFPPWKDDVGI